MLLAGIPAVIIIAIYYGIAETEEMNDYVAGLLWFVVALLGCALLIGTTGTTVGKWLMGIRLTPPDGGGIGVGRALRRELHCFAAGLGLGMPLLMLIMGVVSYQHLTRDGATAWDKDKDWVVTHRPRGSVQVVLGAIGVLLLLFLALVVVALSGME